MHLVVSRRLLLLPVVAMLAVTCGGAAVPAAVITAVELNPFEPTTRSPCGNCFPTSMSTFDAVPARPEARIASGLSPLAWVTKAEKSTSAVLYGIVREIVMPFAAAAVLKISAPSAANFWSLSNMRTTFFKLSLSFAALSAAGSAVSSPRDARKIQSHAP